MAMQDLFSPKQVARAIEVSESSIKRWCDHGLIPTHCTAGGHRRIPMSGLVEFLRNGKHDLLRPEALGLPATTGQTKWVIDRAAENLADALTCGDEERCRQITLDLYLAEHRTTTICDDVFARGFENIGERWECGSAEVYQERRAGEIALRVLRELRAFLPRPTAEAPVAMGGAPEGDQYNLATTMVELVLRDAGWNATSLGDNLPFATLAAAIKNHQPRLFWLSASHISDESKFLAEYQAFYDEFGLQVAIVVGGRALSEDLRQHMKYAAFCDNMQHLEATAQALLPPASD